VNLGPGRGKRHEPTSKRDDHDQVCSFDFSYIELRASMVMDSDCHVRGNDGHGWPSARPGDVAKTVLGVRFS